MTSYAISAYHQDSINSIIGTRAKQWTGIRIHTTTHKNKTVSVNKIKYIQNMYLLYWYFQQNQCLNIKKHAVHNIHRLAWSPYSQEPMATAQHALRRHWLSPLTLWVWILLMVRCTRYLMWYIPIYRVPFYFSINTIHELLTLCMPFRYSWLTIH